MAAPLIVPAVKRHTATVILAHGLGDSGAGWVSLAENWRRRQKFEEVKFIFPNAPNIPITVVSTSSLHAYTIMANSAIERGYANARMVRYCKTWHDSSWPETSTGLLGEDSALIICGQTNFGDLLAHEDETGILRSREYFHNLITTEVDGGIPSNRIVLGGFSQGGSISLISGVTCPTKLGGIFGLSSYLLLHNKIKELTPGDNPNKDTPIFMGHGDRDPLVLPQWGMLTAQTLKQMGWRVDLKMYP